MAILVRALPTGLAAISAPPADAVLIGQMLPTPLASLRRPPPGRLRL